jgi:hypothetical protein
LDAENKKAPEGVINQRDLGSRRRSSATVVKDEAMDMEIDLEIDDLPAARKFYI